MKNFGVELKLLTGVVLLWVIGACFVVWPIYREQLAACQELERLRTQASETDGGGEELVTLQEQHDELHDYSEAFTSHIPRNSDVASLIRKLSDTLDSLGITDREISTDLGREQGEVSYVPMTVKIEGPFLSVYSAMDWIESLDRLVRVSRARYAIQANAGHQSRGPVKVELQLEVFYSPLQGLPQGSSGSVASAGEESAR